MSSIKTRVGRAGADDYDHFGVRVFRDLVGKTSYLGLIAFAITGRKLSREDEQVLDDVAVCSHVPEPRVWPMKLTRVVGSLGRPMPAFLCGSTVLDSDLLGGRVAGAASELLLELSAAVAGKPDRAAAIETFVRNHSRMIGFGVPVRSVDERVVALRKQLTARGRTNRFYWDLGEAFWAIAKDTRGLVVNIIGAVAAVCLDLGFRPHEVAPMAAMLLQPTLLSNSVEAAAEPAAALHTLPRASVDYTGPAPRTSPRANKG